ncbi:uncharacterized protein LOC123225769 [Mangifera indica]|uniref:uncharacterized protein LOC123225769 n=1 Tax=Mangifera indica TaxID=29780 RepID=UPI001CFB0751|nr:uncharacterized protein LOC123225769 [Mangifera indica]
MPGFAQAKRNNEQFSNAYSIPANGFWSKNSDDVGYNQLQKFWSDLSPQARKQLLRIDKQSLFEQARKYMYCSRCNGLLLEGFLQIVMYGKSLQQDGTVAQLPSNRTAASKIKNDCGSTMTNGCQNDFQDPSIHPWGGLTTTRDGSLTLLDCYLCSKSLKGLQNVFDSAHARERERELLYPDACGGAGRGWISQGIASFGRVHGTRETCALHTARLSCDTLVDFWSALGEETRQSLLRMKEEDFIERLMYRFDSKRFCRDCRRNVIREFKELKELRRMRREPRCTSWFCAADTAFQYEVSDDTVQADWHQTFSDTFGTHHHFEWAVGTGQGKSDILEFENVGINGSVQVSGLDLSGLSACFITLRAWKIDGRCTELSVKAHALNGEQCVHCRLVVGDGFVTITRGESIRRFFDHAEEAEEEEDEDSMDKDGNDLDGECFRPQKHAKSPELAREFLLDAATVIFKEQVEKAFREGTARQNVHSIFICLALKLLDERIHVACKEIITLEKQMKLLEEEEKEKREEEERKQRRRMKEREKKLRRKERLRGKERDKIKKYDASDHTLVHPDVSKDESLPSVDEESSNAINCRDTVRETGDFLSRPGSPEILHEQYSNGCSTSQTENYSYHSPDGEVTSAKDGNGSFQMEQSKFSRRSLKFRKEARLDSPLKWSEKQRFAVVSVNGSMVNRSESRYHTDNYEIPRGSNGLNQQLWVNTSKSSHRNCGVKYNEKVLCSNNRLSDRYDHSCSCNQHNEFQAKVEPHVSATRVSRGPKSVSMPESALDISKQFYCGNEYYQIECMHDTSGRSKSKIIMGNSSSNRDSLYPKKVWEPMEVQKKHLCSNSDSDVTLKSTTYKGETVEHDYSLVKSSGETYTSNANGNLHQNDHEDVNMKKSRDYSLSTDEACLNGIHLEAKDACYSTEAASDEAGLCHNRNSTLTRISDPNMSSTSNSDNCSSCLSEGDSNTVSSNHGNLESSSTSDSEDASQQSEGRDASECTQNVFSESHEVEMEKKRSTNGVENLVSRTLNGFPHHSMGSKFQGNLLTKTSQNPDKEISNGSSAEHQGYFQPLHNQNMQFSVFQPPPMGYYHQNPVSWSSAPINGVLSFPHTNHYWYAGPLGYGLNGNTCMCMQYGALPHVPTSVFNPSLATLYQPVTKSNCMEEQTHFFEAGIAQEPLNDANTKTAAPAGSYLSDVPANTEVGQNDDSVNLGNNFSLFHFGGPVALSTGCKLNSMPSKDEIVGNFSSQFLADHVENDHACTQKDITIEEYNLFAATNGIRFPFF